MKSQLNQQEGKGAGTGLIGGGTRGKMRGDKSLIEGEQTVEVREMEIGIPQHLRETTGDGGT